MANLKQDLLNNLGNKKYYIELELARQAQDPSMVYSEKIDSMSEILMDIADIDLSTQLVAKYFPEEAPVEVPAAEDQKTEQIVEQPHKGQSHAE